MTPPDVPAHIEAGARAWFDKAQWGTPWDEMDGVSRMLWESDAIAVWQAAARELLKDEDAMYRVWNDMDRASGTAAIRAILARFLGVEDTKEDA